MNILSCVTSDEESLADRLVENLIAWTQQHWPGSEAFALGLAFGVGWPPIPAPGIVTANERDAWVADPDEYGVGLVLWNPGEYEISGDAFAEGLPARVGPAARRHGSHTAPAMTARTSAGAYVVVNWPRWA
jgi:hypothetical protein